MKYLSYIVIPLALFWACSSNVTKEGAGLNERNLSGAQDNKRKAQERFINGSILEMKGQFNEAIAEYLEALKHDPGAGINYTLAKNFLKTNKLSYALKYAQSAVKLDSTNTEYLFLLAAIYGSARQSDSAISVYEKIVSIDSLNTAAYFQLAQLYEKSRPSYSITLYKKLIDLIGPEWNILVNLADLNERMGNVNETIKTLEELIKLLPMDIQLQKLLIDAYLKTNEYDKAINLAEQGLVSYPDDIGFLEQKANALIQKNSWKEAAGEYQKLLRSDKINFETKLKICSIFMAASEIDSTNLDIAESFLTEIDKDTLDWQVNSYLGEIEIRKRNDSTAVEYFKKALLLAEWNAPLWLRLGGILFDTRKYSEAVEYMSKASEKFPNDFGINLIYGLSLSQQDNHQAAKTYLKRALNIQPSDITTLTAYGYTLNQLKETEEALSVLSKAMSLNPEDIQLLSMTALIYDSQKNFKMSDSLYTVALGLDPENSLILNNFAYSLSERKLRLEEALEMSSKAVEQDPENSSYLDTIGWIYYQMEDYTKAKDYIEKSLVHDSENSTVIDHLGDVYFKLGKIEKAKELWIKALEIEPTNSEIQEKINKGEL